MTISDVETMSDRVKRRCLQPEEPEYKLAAASVVLCDSLKILLGACSAIANSRSSIYTHPKIAVDLAETALEQIKNLGFEDE